MTLWNDVTDESRAWATISRDGVYRYTLGRRWAPGPTVCWVMLNPSTADADVDDPTIRRVVSFSKASDVGFGSAVVVNLYALRSTDPSEIAHHPDPVGPLNDDTIGDVVLDDTVPIVCAWGTKGGLRAAHLLDTLFAGVELWCLGVTQDGHPRHPLYVPAAQPFEMFRPRQP